MPAICQRQNMKVSGHLSAVFVLGLLLLHPAARVESRGTYHWYTMFMFGDSFADTGNLPKTGCESPLSRQWHYPYGTFNKGQSGNPIGRFSNYLVQSEYHWLLGRLEAPPAYKRTMKHYCDQSGMTFAVGGAGVYEVPDQVSTLAQQVDSFKKLIKDGTISKWHLGDSVALVAISGNDYAQAANSSNLIGFIGNVTTEIVANVQRLQNLGVKKILVNNLHPVGCTPWLSRTKNYTSCDSRGNLGSSIHNSYLKQKLVNETENVHILDLNTAFSNIVNQAPGEGSKLSKRFKHKLEPCCESFDPEGYCGQRDKNSKHLYSLCSNPSKYFYWDAVHPTQADGYTRFSFDKEGKPSTSTSIDAHGLALLIIYHV